MRKPLTLSELAARWYIRMRHTKQDAPERREFEQWLSLDARHAAEYESIAGLMRQLDSKEALSSLADAAEQQAFMAQESKRKLKQRRVGQLMVIGMFCVIGYFTHQQYQVWQAAPVMQMAALNPVGQIAIKTLDDGTKVTLSAKSEMEVTYYRHERHVLLKEGEAVFDVEKDPERPFVVETDTAVVTVLGTRFAVNRLDQLVRVSVDHGRVKVAPKLAAPSKATATEAPLESREITNGQVVEVYPNHATVLVNRPAADAFAFLTGRLVFDRADLGEIASTVSRYRLKPVQSQGRQIRNISADINIHNIDQFLHGLPNIAAVQVQETPQYTLLNSQR
ncbi:FecR family protein [Methylophilus aquaticus]|uniref:FecR domain-containing protein n=1 Tax=Methylophilus aquaticus TaxID=1971610 RepID=A0ABT9JQQ3_9PROT|nr:FecR domain-containing protein [Methylophilus aquaticus]MDP8566892.1 FecR domain-containing protein [Methylophilus aquaticus]